MNIIGKNVDSNLKLYLHKSGAVSIVPSKTAELADYKNSILEKWYEDENDEEVVVVDNFSFTATLVPQKWGSSRESGSIYFVDTDEDGNTVFRMTQRNLFDLLEHIISGKVKVKNGGLYGLYTFDARGAILTIMVYE